MEKDFNHEVKPFFSFGFVVSKKKVHNKLRKNLWGISHIIFYANRNHSICCLACL